MATIRDVAQRAGVSTMTVSRVLNNSGYVSAEARTRVEAAVSELGYVPNTLGLSLRFKRTKTLALVVTDITNPFFTSMVRGVEDAPASTGSARSSATRTNPRRNRPTTLRSCFKSASTASSWCPARSAAGPVQLAAAAQRPGRHHRPRGPGAHVDCVRGQSEAGGHDLAVASLRFGPSRSGSADRTALWFRRQRNAWPASCAQLGRTGHFPGSGCILYGSFTVPSGYAMTSRCSGCTHRRRPSWPRTTSSPSAPTGRSATPGCTCPTTYHWSPSITCPSTWSLNPSSPWPSSPRTRWGSAAARDPARPVRSQVAASRKIFSSQTTLSCVTRAHLRHSSLRKTASPHARFSTRRSELATQAQSYHWRPHHRTTNRSDVRGNPATLGRVSILITVIFMILAPTFRQWVAIKDVLENSTGALHYGDRHDRGAHLGRAWTCPSARSSRWCPSSPGSLLLVDAPWWLAVLGGLVAGMLCGVTNGLIIVGTRIPTLIATLGTQLIFRGVRQHDRRGQGHAPVSRPSSSGSARARPAR